MRRRVPRILLAAALVGALASPALAVRPDEIMQDPAQEKRARALSADLRCLVCQNQSIDDSDAPLARDLRVLVREKIAEGRSDREIMDFLVARYGEFVLLRPRLDAGTLLLWLGPFVVLALGAGGIWSALRRRRAAAVPALTEEERRRLAALVGEGPDARG
jgi:cytochrome c-type biogenesis protein CcmH